MFELCVVAVEAHLLDDTRSSPDKLEFCGDLPCLCLMPRTVCPNVSLRMRE